jgi:hypothetical protein
MKLYRYIVSTLSYSWEYGSSDLEELGSEQHAISRCSTAVA